MRACNSCDRWRVKRFLCGSVIVVLLQRPFYQAIWHRVSKITNLIDTASNLLDFSNNTTNQILLCKQKTCKPINVMGQKYWIRVSNKKNNGIREKERSKSLHIIQYIKTYYNVNLLLVKLIWYLFQLWQHICIYLNLNNYGSTNNAKQSIRNLNAEDVEDPFNMQEYSEVCCWL